MSIIMSLLLLYSCSKLNEMDHINVIFINKLFVCQNYIILIE